jgi:gluconokinase
MLMRKAGSDFLLLAIDIGTSSTRTAFFDDRARRLPETIAAEQYGMIYGSDGRAELSPFDLLGAVTRARSRTLRSYQNLPLSKRLPVSAIGGSALWHGLLGLDRHYRPITPVFTWADSRAAPDARRLRARFDERRIHQRTGCMLRATFWPAKLCWLQRTQPKLFRQVKYWVSPSDWIFHALFGDLKCSASMASATGFYNFHRNTWETELMDSCHIDAASLSPIANRLTYRPSLKDQIRTVFCPIGDGAASNVGSGAVDSRVAAINVGTSAAIRTILSRKAERPSSPPLGLFRYVVDQTRSITGGATSNAGNLRQWCLRELRIEQKREAIERVFSREAAANDSLTILPFWVEERAPTWPEGQLGLIDGLSQTTTANQIARATATAVFYRISQILDRLEISLGKMRRIIVSGGILQSPASVKLLADAIGRNLEISSEPEASLRGAAVYALNRLGIKVKTARSGKIVRHKRALASLHHERRERQIRMERLVVP